MGQNRWRAVWCGTRNVTIGLLVVSAVACSSGTSERAATPTSATLASTVVLSACDQSLQALSDAAGSITNTVQLTREPASSALDTTLADCATQSEWATSATGYAGLDLSAANQVFSFACRRAQLVHDGMVGLSGTTPAVPSICS